MLQVSLLLGGAQALALLGLGFVVIARFGLLLCAASLGGQLLGDALRLGLLVRSGFGVSLGLRLFSLLSLLTLDFRVFGGVPRI